MQRLDVGTSGVMVITKSEHGYSILKNAFRHRTVDKVYHALVQGHPDPLEGTVDAPIGRHPGADYKFAVMATGGTRSPTTRPSRPTGSPRCSRCTSRPVAPTRSASTWPPSSTPASATSPTAPTRCWPRRLGLRRQWLHAVGLGFVHPDSGEYVEFTSSYPDDLAEALEKIRDAD